MKKITLVTFLSIFIIFNSLAETTKKKKFVPLGPDYEEGTKEYVQYYCPEFNDGKNNCIEDLNTALKYSFRITETYKEGKYVIYMLRKTNKIAMCKVNTKDASSWCELVY
tara:strand:+ start:106 stop:435 length:330 start_codon:yes stop_codon:yes gene_type:complete